MQGDILEKNAPGWGRDVNLLNPERAGIFHILAYLRTHTAKEISSRVNTKLDGGIKYTPMYKRLMDEPEKYRWEHVRFQGVVKQISRKPNGDADMRIWTDKGTTDDKIIKNPSGIYRVYEIYAKDKTSGKICVIFTIDEPKTLKENDIITVSGIFFKRWAYQNRDNKYTYAPLIFAKQATLMYQKGGIEKSSVWLYLIAGIVLVIAGIVIHRDLKRNDNARSNLVKYQNRKTQSIRESAVSRKDKTQNNITSGVVYED